MTKRDYWEGIIFSATLIIGLPLTIVVGAMLSQ